MEQLLIKYGALAVFLAALIEADVVPVLTGVVVHLGFLKVGPALFAAMAGAFVGDYAWFCAGLYFSHSIQSSRLYSRIKGAPQVLIRRLGLWQIPASHLMYGTRVSTMIWWGVQRISTVRFALVDALGCVVLTGVLFMLGFAFSSASGLVIRRVKQFELLVLVGIVLGLILFGKALRSHFENPASERDAE